MRTITLSFDNGPDPEVTPQVLDVLARRGIKASFFVLGDKLRDRRAHAERAHAEGHWIANHTMTHQMPLGTAPEPGLSVAEIARTQELIGDLAHERRFFRPMGGGGNLDGRLLNAEAFDYLRRERFTCVLWNLVPQDWIHRRGWVERALAMIEAGGDEALAVLHDTPTGAMDRLDDFTAAALERGWRFRQAFPASCVPMERGEVVSPMEAYVSTTSAFAH